MESRGGDNDEQQPQPPSPDKARGRKDLSLDPRLIEMNDKADVQPDSLTSKTAAEAHSRRRSSALPLLTKELVVAAPHLKVRPPWVLVESKTYEGDNAYIFICCILSYFFRCHLFLKLNIIALFSLPTILLQIKPIYI
jgi:hypothetical protein